jgi:hypothetical protein
LKEVPKSSAQKTISQKLLQLIIKMEEQRVGLFASFSMKLYPV